MTQKELAQKQTLTLRCFHFPKQNIPVCELCTVPHRLRFRDRRPLHFRNPDERSEPQFLAVIPLFGSWMQDDYEYLPQTPYDMDHSARSARSKARSIRFERARPQRRRNAFGLLTH